MLKSSTDNVKSVSSRPLLERLREVRIHGHPRPLPIFELNILAIPHASGFVGKPLSLQSKIQNSKSKISSGFQRVKQFKKVRKRYSDHFDIGNIEVTAGRTACYGKAHGYAVIIKTVNYHRS
jgi:hypothetical protein